MSENEKRTCGQVELDFDRIGRIGSKLNELLVRKTKGSLEAYAVLRFMCTYYEEELQLTFEPQFDEEIRRVVKENIKACHEASPDPAQNPNSLLNQFFFTLFTRFVVGFS
jgi:hypothetical protein